MNRAIIARHLTVAAIAGALTLCVNPSSAQVVNESGWSQPSATGDQYGQTESGTHWRTQNVGGTEFYSDDHGKECWSQPSVTGGTFTSCR
jgi:hypothetical protein